ncbi:MAG: PAS domain S-box protein [Spirochaetales bacterium]|nr:PAS domain S-box protein [Spirochaetales bacterium]
MSPYEKELEGFDLSAIDGWNSAFVNQAVAFSEPGILFGREAVALFAPAFFSYVEHRKPTVDAMVVLILPLKELFRDIEGVTIGNSGSVFVTDKKERLVLNGGEKGFPGIRTLFHGDSSLDQIIRAMTDRKSGFGTYRNDEGSQYISFSPVREVEWSLGVKGAYQDITAGINLLVQVSITVIFLGLILALVILYFVVHRVVAPIEELTLMAGHIEKGDFRQELMIRGTGRKIFKTDDEVSKLIIAFNKMSGQLEQTFENLNEEIEERRRVEDALLEAKQYINDIIDSMPSVIIGVDSRGNITHWNSAAEAWTGIKAGKASGAFLPDLVPLMSDDMDNISQSIHRDEPVYIKKKVHESKNNTLYKDVTIYPLSGHESRRAVIRIDDVTEKVRMEEVLIQSEKMLSVGGLAAGMAHEINNPLAGMMQTASVMENRLSRNLHMASNRKTAEKLGISLESLREFLEERGILRMLSSIGESGKRVAGIVDNMLSFSRKSERVNSTHNLEELLEKTLVLAGSDYDLKKQSDFRKIRIVREYEDDIPPVLCEGSKIQQVLLNLLRNGAQAMEEAETESPCFTLRLYSDKKSGMVYLEISDNGPGMDEETRKRVFEPFFTTKPVGSGTGLGLSVSYFIITEQHKGQMTVRSAKGAGTSFTVGLPL